MISCGCDISDFDVHGAGDQRIVTCRTPRRCSDCGEEINAGDIMYMQSMYDRGAEKLVAPRFHCEPCGDLLETLFDAGYCVTFGNVRAQWLEQVRRGGDV